MTARQKAFSKDLPVVCSDAFAFELDTRDGLKALRWRNQRTGQTLDLGGGAELEVEVDAAKDRIWIEGWNFQRTDREPVAPEAESGFKAGYHRFDYPDIHEHLADAARWPAATGLFFLVADTTYWAWARTRVFLPESAAGEPLTFRLGGFGIGDFRHTRVFVNGALLGERRVDGRWFEPGAYVVGPGDPAYAALRFGQVNVLALQLGGAIDRSERLDEFDPAHAHHLPYQQVTQPPYLQQVEVGERPMCKLSFAIESCLNLDGAAGTELRVILAAAEAPLKAELHYRPADAGRTLLKSVTLVNTGSQSVRLTNLCLGDYPTGAVVTEGDMGFPVYADGAFFLSLDHPAGWAMGAGGRVRLRQFPGALLRPGERFSCMNTVLGVADAGGARAAFLEHLTPRTRRVRRGHDRPYAIMSMFGGWPMVEPEKLLEDELSEETCLRYAQWLSAFRDRTGTTFDLVSVDFWQDPAADLVKFNHRFPDGFDRARQALTATGARHGLWIDRSGFARWHVGLNPLVLNCLVGQPSYAARGFDKGWGYAPICRAAEPVRSIFRSAFLRHVREGGARLLKFDNLGSTCHNQSHGHWPGLYSTAAIYDSVIEFFTALDEACPEVFIMLYWGYRSPWWLLYGDTQFECGLKIEASSPSPTPSLYTRDGVTVTLDQGTAFMADLPKLGKDSLGVWLSRWPWNSSIGKERWREAAVMDLCRGNLLFQPWMGEDALEDGDERDLAGFMRLLRARPDCFRNSRPILGDPWKTEPYGYLCSDAQRAFVAVNNFGWRDYAVSFDEPSAFGLAAAATAVRVFRHYPEPGELSEPADCLRPFQVALYELAIDGGTPSLASVFPKLSGCRNFRNATVAVPVEVRTTDPDLPKTAAATATAANYDEVKTISDAWRGFAVSGSMPAAGAGLLALAATASCEGRAVPTGSMGAFFRARCALTGSPLALTPVLPDKTYPATWQAWRVGVPDGDAGRPFEFVVSCRLPGEVGLAFTAHFIPESA